MKKKGTGRRSGTEKALYQRGGRYHCQQVCDQWYGKAEVAVPAGERIRKRMDCIWGYRQSGICELCG